MNVMFDIDVKRNFRMFCQSNVRFISSTKKCINNMSTNQSICKLSTSMYNNNIIHVYAYL